MARILIQATNKTISDEHTGELSDADRRAMRVRFDQNPMIRLYEVLPTTLAERQSWGRAVPATAAETFMRYATAAAS